MAKLKREYENLGEEIGEVQEKLKTSVPYETYRDIAREFFGGRPEDSPELRDTEQYIDAFKTLLDEHSRINNKLSYKIQVLQKNEADLVHDQAVIDEVQILIEEFYVTNTVIMDKIKYLQDNSIGTSIDGFQRILDRYGSIARNILVNISESTPTPGGGTRIQLDPTLTSGELLHELNDHHKKYEDREQRFQAILPEVRALKGQEHNAKKAEFKKILEKHIKDADTVKLIMDQVQSGMPESGDTYGDYLLDTLSMFEKEDMEDAVINGILTGYTGTDYCKSGKCVKPQDRNVKSQIDPNELFKLMQKMNEIDRLFCTDEELEELSGFFESDYVKDELQGYFGTKAEFFKSLDKDKIEFLRSVNSDENMGKYVKSVFTSLDRSKKVDLQKDGYGIAEFRDSRIDPEAFARRREILEDRMKKLNNNEISMADRSYIIHKDNKYNKGSLRKDMLELQNMAASSVFEIAKALEGELGFDTTITREVVNAMAEVAREQAADMFFGGLRQYDYVPKTTKRNEKTDKEELVCEYSELDGDKDDVKFETFAAHRLGIATQKSGPMSPAQKKLNDLFVGSKEREGIDGKYGLVDKNREFIEELDKIITGKDCSPQDLYNRVRDLTGKYEKYGSLTKKETTKVRENLDMLQAGVDGGKITDRAGAVKLFDLNDLELGCVRRNGFLKEDVPNNLLKQFKNEKEGSVTFSRFLGLDYDGSDKTLSPIITDMKRINLDILMIDIIADEKENKSAEKTKKVQRLFDKDVLFDEQRLKDLEKNGITSHKGAIKNPEKEAEKKKASRSELDSPYGGFPIRRCKKSYKLAKEVVAKMFANIQSAGYGASMDRIFNSNKKESGFELWKKEYCTASYNKERHEKVREEDLKRDRDGNPLEKYSYFEEWKGFDQKKTTDNTTDEGKWQDMKVMALGQRVLKAELMIELGKIDAEILAETDEARKEELLYERYQVFDSIGLTAKRMTKYVDINAGIANKKYDDKVSTYENAVESATTDSGYTKAYGQKGIQRITKKFKGGAIDLHDVANINQGKGMQIIEEIAGGYFANIDSDESKMFFKNLFGDAYQEQIDKLKENKGVFTSVEGLLAFLENPSWGWEDLKRKKVDVLVEKPLTSEQKQQLLAQQRQQLQGAIQKQQEIIQAAMRGQTVNGISITTQEAQNRIAEAQRQIAVLNERDLGK
ncbi:MAG: hypothetical protein FWE45_04120 [Firmicutes bacterium]|nr:hypothetical protein [Bacillota bacterium]